MCFLSNTLWKGGSWVILSVLAFHIVIVPSYLQSHWKVYVQAAVIFITVTHRKHLKECHQERVAGRLCNLGLGKSERHGMGLVAGAGFCEELTCIWALYQFLQSRVVLFTHSSHTANSEEAVLSSVSKSKQSHSSNLYKQLCPQSLCIWILNFLSEASVWSVRQPWTLLAHVGAAILCSRATYSWVKAVNLQGG